MAGSAHKPGEYGSEHVHVSEFGWFPITSTAQALWQNWCFGRFHLRKRDLWRGPITRWKLFWGARPLRA